MYIVLFHGRDNPEQDMDDWGYDGPVFGPYDSVSVTYFCDVKLCIDHDIVDTLINHEGLVYYNNEYFGDFDIISNEEFEKTPRYKAQHQRFDKDKERFDKDKAGDD